MTPNELTCDVCGRPATTLVRTKHGAPVVWQYISTFRCDTHKNFGSNRYVEHLPLEPEHAKA